MQKPLNFLLIFAVAYILLNILYQALLYVYYPLPDPFTVWITKCTLLLMPDLNYRYLIDAPGLRISDGITQLVNVKEGCNGIAVWMSLLSFMIAYRSGLRSYLIFVPLTFLIIQVCNILRLYILIRVKISQAQYFNFFHTYAFPAIIYLIAFLLMVVWVRWFVYRKEK